MRHFVTCDEHATIFLGTWGEVRDGRFAMHGLFSSSSLYDFERWSASTTTRAVKEEKDGLRRYLLNRWDGHARQGNTMGFSRTGSFDDRTRGDEEKMWAIEEPHPVSDASPGGSPVASKESSCRCKCCRGAHRRGWVGQRVSESASLAGLQGAVRFIRYALERLEGPAPQPKSPAS